MEIGQNSYGIPFPGKTLQIRLKFGKMMNRSFPSPLQIRLRHRVGCNFIEPPLD